MSVTAMSWAMSLGAGVIALLVVTLICGSETMGSRNENMPISARVGPAGPKLERPQGDTVWIHSLPARPFTKQQAREVMRLHLDCDPMMCPRKRMARQALIDTGVIRPRKRVQ